MSADVEFLRSMLRLASAKAGRELTEDEAHRILERFNELEGDAQERALRAISDVVGGETLVEGLRKSANIDNSRRLLADLARAADNWQSTKRQGQ